MTALIRRLMAPMLVAMTGWSGSVALANPATCKIDNIALSLTGGAVSSLDIILNDGARAGDPNSDQGAIVWDEPMQLRHLNGSVCNVSADVLNITQPMFAVGQEYLYVNTFSGSNATIYAVSVKDCRIAWQSPKFNGFVTLAAGRLKLPDGSDLVLGRNCLPVASNHPHTLARNPA